MRTKTGSPLNVGLCSCSNSVQIFDSATNLVSITRDPPGVKLCFDPSYHWFGMKSYVERASNLDGTVDTRKQWNDFEHHKVTMLDHKFDSQIPVISCQYLAGDSDYERFFVSSPLYGWDNGPFGPPDNPFAGATALYEFKPDGHFVNVPSSISSYIGMSLRAMLPVIKANLSLVNSVIELKDFKTLPLTLKRLAEIPRKKNLPLRGVLRAAADAYLQREFNLAPLFSDIIGIQDALKHTRDKVNKLLNQEGQVLVHHYNGTLSGYKDSDETSGVYGPYDFKLTNQCGQSPVNGKTIGKCQMHRTVQYLKRQFHAQIQYSYRFSEFQRQHAQILGMLDALGVNLNPRIIWNAIPWSFVIDWVIGVGQWLDQFKISNLEPVTVIHKYLYSVLISRQASVSITTNIDTGGRQSPVTVPASLVTEEAFRRVCSIPTELTEALTASGFSFKEFSLASALVIGRRR